MQNAGNLYSYRKTVKDFELRCKKKELYLSKIELSENSHN